MSEIANTAAFILNVLSASNKEEINLDEVLKYEHNLDQNSVVQIDLLKSPEIKENLEKNNRYKNLIIIRDYEIISKENSMSLTDIDLLENLDDNKDHGDEHNTPFYLICLPQYQSIQKDRYANYFTEKILHDSAYSDQLSHHFNPDKVWELIDEAGNSSYKFLFFKHKDEVSKVILNCESVHKIDQDYHTNFSFQVVINNNDPIHNNHNLRFVFPNTVSYNLENDCKVIQATTGLIESGEANFYLENLHRGQLANKYHSNASKISIYSMSDHVYSKLKKSINVVRNLLFLNSNYNKLQSGFKEVGQNTPYKIKPENVIESMIKNVEDIFKNKGNLKFDTVLKKEESDSFISGIFELCQMDYSFFFHLFDIEENTELLLNVNQGSKQMVNISEAAILTLCQFLKYIGLDIYDFSRDNNNKIYNLSDNEEDSVNQILEIIKTAEIKRLLDSGNVIYGNIIKQENYHELRNINNINIKLKPEFNKELKDLLNSQLKIAFHNNFYNTEESDKKKVLNGLFSLYNVKKHDEIPQIVISETAESFISSKSVVFSSMWRYDLFKEYYHNTNEQKSWKYNIPDPTVFDYDQYNRTHAEYHEYFNSNFLSDSEPLTKIQYADNDEKLSFSLFLQKYFYSLSSDLIDTIENSVENSVGNLTLLIPKNFSKWIIENEEKHPDDIDYIDDEHFRRILDRYEIEHINREFLDNLKTGDNSKYWNMISSTNDDKQVLIERMTENTFSIDLVSKQKKLHGNSVYETTEHEQTFYRCQFDSEDVKYLKNKRQQNITVIFIESLPGTENKLNHIWKDVDYTYVINKSDKLDYILSNLQFENGNNIKTANRYDELATNDIVLQEKWNKYIKQDYDKFKIKNCKVSVLGSLYNKHETNIYLDYRMCFVKKGSAQFMALIQKNLDIDNVNLLNNYDINLHFVKIPDNDSFSFDNFDIEQVKQVIQETQTESYFIIIDNLTLYIDNGEDLSNQSDGDRLNNIVHDYISSKDLDRLSRCYLFGRIIESNQHNSTIRLELYNDDEIIEIFHDDNETGILGVGLLIMIEALFLGKENNQGEQQFVFVNTDKILEIGDTYTSDDIRNTDILESIKQGINDIKGSDISTNPAWLYLKSLLTRKDITFIYNKEHLAELLDEDYNNELLEKLSKLVIRENVNFDNNNSDYKTIHGTHTYTIKQDDSKRQQELVEEISYTISLDELYPNDENYDNYLILPDGQTSKYYNIIIDANDNNYEVSEAYTSGVDNSVIQTYVKKDPKNTYFYIFENNSTINPITKIIKTKNFNIIECKNPIDLEETETDKITNLDNYFEMSIFGSIFEEYVSDIKYYIDDIKDVRDPTVHLTLLVVPNARNINDDNISSNMLLKGYVEDGDENIQTYQYWNDNLGDDDYNETYGYYPHLNTNRLLSYVDGKIKVNHQDDSEAVNVVDDSSDHKYYTTYNDNILLIPNENFNEFIIEEIGLKIIVVDDWVKYQEEIEHETLEQALGFHNDKVNDEYSGAYYLLEKSGLLSYVNNPNHEATILLVPNSTIIDTLKNVYDHWKQHELSKIEYDDCGTGLLTNCNTDKHECHEFNTNFELNATENHVINYSIIVNFLNMMETKKPELHAILLKLPREMIIPEKIDCTLTDTGECEESGNIYINLLGNQISFENIGEKQDNILKNKHIYFTEYLNDSVILDNIQNKFKIEEPDECQTSVNDVNVTSNYKYEVGSDSILYNKGFEIEITIYNNTDSKVFHKENDSLPFVSADHNAEKPWHLTGMSLIDSCNESVSFYNRVIEHKSDALSKVVSDDDTNNNGHINNLLDGNYHSSTSSFWSNGRALKEKASQWVSFRLWSPKLNCINFYQKPGENAIDQMNVQVKVYGDCHQNMTLEKTLHFNNYKGSSGSQSIATFDFNNENAVNNCCLTSDCC